MKVACLHGNTQTGEVFRTRLDPLLSKSTSKFSFDFPDGPILLEKEDGDDVHRRSWFQRKSPTGADDVTPKTFPLTDVYLRSVNVVLGFSQGGLLGVAAALKSDSVRLCIVAGAPDASWIDLFTKSSSAGKSRYLKIIFLAGDSDAVVPLESTRKLFERVKASTFAECVFETFSGNHFFPVTPKHCEDYLRAMEQWQELAGSTDSCDVQREEIQILQSIYMDNLKIKTPAPETISDPCFRVGITLSPEIRLDCAAQADYPADRLAIVKVVSTVSGVGSEKRRMAMQKVVDDALKTLKGEMQLFACAAAVQDALAQYSVDDVDGNQNEGVELVPESQPPVGETEPLVVEEENEEEMNEMVREATNEARARVLTVSNADDTRQGHWSPFCIGLLGKPSAGKSSFFNACTQNALQGRRQAEVGAAPFTTIDPNFGQAFCELKPGFKVPVLVKDVAGLVPGAYKGLGKGNRFLNDLLDASALLHICDGTGSADEGGRIIDVGNGGVAGDAGASAVGALQVNASTGSPEQVTRDALWVLREVHLWIYGNVTAKWPRPKNRQGSTNHQNRTNAEKTLTTRVCQLFAGYHASNAVTCRAARLAGLDLEKALEFTKRDRHRLCAFFIAVRFPVVLCLNKFDSFAAAGSEDVKLTDKARGIIQESQKVMGHESLVVATSAKLENELVGLVLANKIEDYDSAHGKIVPLRNGGGGKELKPKLDAIQKQMNTLMELNQTICGGVSTSGVHLALVKAIEAAKPLICTAVTTQQHANQKEFLMYPGSTVYDLYEACVRAQFLAGDFVRAEEVSLGSGGITGGKTLSRDACLRDHLSVRIATNKRVVHQQKAAWGGT